jgi:hypothetical protein
MKSFKWFLILLCLLLIVSCSLKPRSWWNEGVIAVMADSTDWEALQGVMRSTFEHVVRTPQVEKTFSLKYVSKSEFARYTEYRHLVLVATLESQGEIGKIVERVVSDPEVHKGVEEGEYYIFTQRNQWAKNQLMIILVSRDLASLRDKIEANADFIYTIYDMDFKDHVKEEMFERSEQKELGNRLMTTYGWTMRFQRDYFLVQELPDQGFIWFRRMLPERWIFVRWIDGGDSTQLTPEWVVGERNRIGAEYYGGDRIASHYFFSQRSSFLGRTAQITSGLWENDAKVKGGPFKNYAFYDPLQRRTYMVDVAVHAPGRDKLPFLRRQEVIAHTFRTVFDMEIDE